MNKFTRKAFTLGEVLIVVAILGAIAVMAVPNLKNNTTSETNITALKTAYNQLETAINTVVTAYGSLQDAKNAPSTDCGSTNEVICLNNSIIKNLDLQLNCQNSNLSRCYSSDVLQDIDGANVASGASYERCSYAFVLSNGASVCYVNRGDSYQFDNYEIDINGPKKGPNVLGVDVFEAYIDANDDLSYDDPSLDASTINSNRKGKNGFVTQRDETAWAMAFGNMDYTKCKASLRWNDITSCPAQ